MEIDDMDAVSGFSNEEKNENYLQIVKTLQFIENGGRITEDWMEENKWVILKWRDWIDDFSDVNEEVQEEAFRKKCRETETIMQYLCHSIHSRKTFDPKTYTILLRHLKFICDSLFTNDEIENMMGMLSM